MPTATRFIVFIERRWRAVATLGWSGCVALLGLALALPAQAQPLSERVRAKVAREMDGELRAERSPRSLWARDLRGVRHVQVIVVSDSSDPDLRELRGAVLRLGGSVHAHHPALHALTVQLPAQRVQALAQRDDVVSVTPNRSVQRTASTLESITATLTPRGRSYAHPRLYTGLDGSGIGIAVLDSGVMRAHRSFAGPSGTRVRRNVTMLNTSLASWATGVDAGSSLAPGSMALAGYEAAVANDYAAVHDAYGHGTHVASFAAGRGYDFIAAPDSTGIAPGANIYDVKVLNQHGTGTLSDVLEGIQWVIYHAREYNIRVMNLSLAAPSTQSWRIDPLCIAARSAAAAGITVVVAAGNFGQSTSGREVHGAIAAPGNDPSVITVGAVNYRNTVGRGDDSVNRFSSRGPTRGAHVDAAGARHVDNLLKPDLVAPGNRIIGAAATSAGMLPSWNAIAAANYAALVQPASGAQYYGETVMLMSGTSISAPAVAGAAALLLQANPGLTPPLVKAILQYSAQPLPGANLLQQGAGLLNVDGALALARMIRPDVASAIAAGTLPPGANLLAHGQAMPSRSSNVHGANFHWSRLVFAGGNQLLSGDALFTRMQPIWDPRLTWAGGAVRWRQPVYWPGTWMTPSGTFVKSFAESTPAAQALVMSSVVHATSLAGLSSVTGRTGAFMPTATLASWLVSGSGLVLSEGIVLSEGLVISEGLVLSEGLVISEGLVLSEGLVMSEGRVISESGGLLVEGFRTEGVARGED